jgi:hypothetical protein
MNTVFLNLETSIDECINVIEAFEARGYETYLDAKVKALKTKAPLRIIGQIAKLFECIESYSI